jgi:hypothetical protein
MMYIKSLLEIYFPFFVVSNMSYKEASARLSELLATPKPHSPELSQQIYAQAEVTFALAEKMVLEKAKVDEDFKKMLHPIRKKYTEECVRNSQAGTSDVTEATVYQKFVWAYAKQPEFRTDGTMTAEELSVACQGLDASFFPTADAYMKALKPRIELLFHTATTEATQNIKGNKKLEEECARLYETWMKSKTKEDMEAFETFIYTHSSVRKNV